MNRGDARDGAREGAAAGGARAGEERAVRAGRWKLLALLVVLASPVIASFYTYFVVRPEGRTNYGALLEPREVREIGGVDLQGRPGSLADLRGRWVLVVLAPPACDRACRERLYQIRQVRLTTGKDRDRVERVWLVEGPGEPDATLLAEHEGLRVLRVPVQAPAISVQFPATDSTAVSDHIWLVDPRGHLMMRFPSEADPSRIKKDLAKLLRASQIG